MTLLGVLVGGTIALLMSGCVSAPVSRQFTAGSSQAHTPTTSPTSDYTAAAKHLEKSREFLKNRDFKAALAEVEQAEHLIGSQVPENQAYVRVLIEKAGVFAYFEHLDEAEATLLQATGIPTNKIRTLSNSRQWMTEEQHRDIADELQELVASDDKSGYHVALSYIYNILGDTQRMEEQQQLAMDASEIGDITVDIAMALYKVGGRKIDVHANLMQQEALAQSDPESPDVQLRLGYAYHLAGWFAEAEGVADKWIVRVDKEQDKDLYVLFLSLKMNVAMSQGQYAQMKHYEAEVLEIDPHAFDE